MQHDSHVWAWRQWRFYMTGLMIGMVEIGATGVIEHRFIDPRDFYT